MQRRLARLKSRSQIQSCFWIIYTAFTSCEQKTTFMKVTNKMQLYIYESNQQDATIYIFFSWRDSPPWARASSFTRFLEHTQRRITVGRTPLDEWSARRRDLYLTTHNTYNRQTSMPPAGFEPTVSAGERPRTYALDRAATGTGCNLYRSIYYY